MNSDLDQVNLIDIYRTLHPKSTEHTFFSLPHHTYSKIDHIIGSKSLLSKCKTMEIRANGLSDHSAIKLYQNSEIKSELHSFMETEQLVLEC